MTLFWCLAAIAVALIIARYNQSNKLFWILMISFLTGIAGAAIYDKLSNGKDDQSEEQLTQVCPTQNIDILAQTIMCLEPTSMTVKCVKPTSVSQDNTPENCEPLFALTAWVRPTHTPPPQITNVYDSS